MQTSYGWSTLGRIFLAAVGTRAGLAAERLRFVRLDKCAGSTPSHEIALAFGCQPIIVPRAWQSFPFGVGRGWQP